MKRRGVRQGLTPLFVLIIVLAIGNLINAQQQSPTRGRLVSSVLTRYGFEPASAETRPGPVQLVFHNRSSSEMRLSILRVASGSSEGVLVERKVKPANQVKLAHLLDLAAGEYLIRDEDNPQWEFRLTVSTSVK